MSDTFDTDFRALTGNAPFPWQRALFHRFLAGDVPQACILPTGLGKTMTLAVWLLALARSQTKVPRRLVYVVNRRTVVDQSTTEAQKLRDNLDKVPAVRQALAGLCALEHPVPLAISTLRGQFADNEAWRTDPARPAIICGTVDMVGSRLLFSGYRIGYKTRPLHAGLLGSGALLIHDEAHLEPAFQKLLDTIVREQGRCKEVGGLRVMQLTATTRGSEAVPFTLSEDDRKHATVEKRLTAKKSLHLHEAEEKAIPDLLANLANQHEKTSKAILVFARTVDAVEKVADRLPKKATQTLTGTKRGKERDELPGDPIFARFLPKDDQKAKTVAEGTVYLICTSAGEVGVNISADHLVGDLTPFDSMAQRFGRVNRFGDGEATVDVVFPNEFKIGNPLDTQRQKTLALLRRLTGVSPEQLAALPEVERQGAFTPEPSILHASDILFDAWSLTTIRERLAGRPPVADWLHGVAEWEPPQTEVAWRADVSLLAPKTRDKEEVPIITPKEIGKLLEAYPLKPQELLRDRTDRVFKHLAKLAERTPTGRAWVVDEEGQVVPKTLRQIADDEKEALEGMTVVLEPKAGGLTKQGLLDGSVKFEEGEENRYDVADLWGDELRKRAWDGNDAEGMREVFTVRPDADPDSDKPRVYRWFVKPANADDEANSRKAPTAQDLQPHLDQVGEIAARIAEKLGETELVPAYRVIGAAHDLGKDRELWQRSVGNLDYPRTTLAKAGKIGGWYTGYRHEFGSLSDIEAVAAFQRLASDMRELALHIVATHHGRGRPHFPEDEAFDPLRTDASSLVLAQAVPQRFARLQSKYGRWRLAFLESILRAADYLASEGKA